MSRPRHTLEEQFYKVKRLQKNLMIKSTVCAVATLAAIAVTVSPVETGLKAQITAALAVIIWAACFKELSEGLISVFGGLPTNDTLNAYAMLAAFAQSIFAIFVPSSGKLYAWVVFVSCSCSAVMKYIYDNIMYAELNTKSDYCMECGYDGEIKIVEEKDSGKLVWECPNCGNRDQDKMSVARRTCGYIGTQFWNQGRTQEIKERVLHL